MTTLELKDLLPYMSWVTPVPVQRVPFVATRRAANEKFGVVVEHARTPSFARVGELSGKHFLKGHGFADLQLNLHSTPGIRGSGRSLHFKGRYLKGVGLTNVNFMSPGLRADSGYHASGNLLPSAGIREYLVAAYLRAHGMSELALSCDDVLFQSNDSLRRSVVRNVYGAVKAAREPLPIDLALSAVTVKSGDFARYTNALWVAANSVSYADAGLGLTEIVALIAHFSLLPQERVRTDVGDYEIEEAFENFRVASERTFLWILKANLLGLSWGSLNNNFALDGRYVDLETPCVFGAFHLGTWRTLHDRTLRHSNVLNMAESYSFVFQFRRSCAELQMHLNAIARRRRQDFPKAIDGLFFQNVARAFERLVLKRSLLFADDAVHRVFREAVLDNCSHIARSKHGALEQLIRRGQEGKISGERDQRVVPAHVLDSQSYLFAESPFTSQLRIVPKAFANEFAVGADAQIMKDAFEHVASATRPAHAAERLRTAEAMVLSRTIKRDVHVNMNAFTKSLSRAGTNAAARTSPRSPVRSRARMP